MSFLKTSSVACQDVAEGRRARGLSNRLEVADWVRLLWGGIRSRRDGCLASGVGERARGGWQSPSCLYSPLRQPTHPSSRSLSLVRMVKASDHRHGNDSPEFRGLNRPSVRRVLLKRKMTTRASIIAEVAGDLSSQRRLVHRDDVIQTLSANRADQPFHVRGGESRQQHLIGTVTIESSGSPIRFTLSSDAPTSW